MHGGGKIVPIISRYCRECCIVWPTSGPRYSFPWLLEAAGGSHLHLSPGTAPQQRSYLDHILPLLSAELQRPDPLSQWGLTQWASWGAVRALLLARCRALIALAVQLLTLQLVVNERPVERNALAMLHLSHLRGLKERVIIKTMESDG